MQLDDPVARTLFIPLYMKAKETTRLGGFFQDEIAVRLIEEFDYDFSIFNKAIRSQIGCSLRTSYFDDLACNFLNDHPDGVIVNVGCGLDSRFERINNKINWPKTAFLYNFDLPEVIALRKQLLVEKKGNSCLEGSLFDKNWLINIRRNHGDTPILFLIEGVLMYFDIDDVKKAIVQMVSSFSNCQVVFDSSSSFMVKRSNLHDSIKYTNAKFKLCLDNPKDVEDWYPKIRLKSVKRYSDFERWRDTGWFNYWLLRLIPRLKNASLLLHLESRAGSNFNH
ncbi:class I SAM-dependent methyltransferase [Aliivibrio fischeri]|uniref:Class I SAM-dependent methyltransferase n=1 Tax=Aliivibrio fischeri TaxID=668 RepID=A0A510UNE3_ALIFS|nr:class I SAM-dependent methyltransferase [Aliivibrio fischeri]MUK51028.1 class I SAM-dependent methyltransferase [Aliivibrio fischeri]GEK15986.1 polyketide synthesis methyltransferase [Aliivibrio fischeri]